MEGIIELERPAILDVKIQREARPMTSNGTTEKKKTRTSSAGHLLTTKQLAEIIKTYNHPNDDGVVMKINQVAEKMKLPAPVINLAIKMLRANGAKIESSSKDEHYKTMIKQLRVDNPDLFHKVAPKALGKNK